MPQRDPIPGEALAHRTEDGCGKDAVPTIAERLLSELATGVESIRKEGGLSVEKAFAGLDV